MLVTSEPTQNESSISQIGGILAVLRSELIVYIQDEFTATFPYVTELHQNNLSQIIARLMNEGTTKAALAPAGFFAPITAASQSMKTIASKLHITSKPTPFFRLYQLSYLSLKADKLEELLNKILAFSYLDALQFCAEAEQNFSTLEVQLTQELEEFDTIIKALITKKYDEKIEAAVGETKHPLFGLLGGNDSSTLAQNLDKRLVRQFKLKSLLSALHAYCQLLIQLKRDQYTTLCQSISKPEQLALMKQSEKQKAEAILSDRTKEVLFRTLALLTEKNKSINELDDLGLSMLHKAIIKGDESSVNILLKAGAKVSVLTRKHGYSALCIAIVNVKTLKPRKDINFKIIEALFNKGADVNETISLYDHTAEELRPIIQCNILHFILFNDPTESPENRTFRENINLKLLELILKQNVDLTAYPVGDQSNARNIPNLLGDNKEQHEAIKLLRVYQQSHLATKCE